MLVPPVLAQLSSIPTKPSLLEETDLGSEKYNDFAQFQNSAIVSLISMSLITGRPLTMMKSTVMGAGDVKMGPSGVVLGEATAGCI